MLGVCLRPLPPPAEEAWEGWPRVPGKAGWQTQGGCLAAGAAAGHILGAAQRGNRHHVGGSVAEPLRGPAGLGALWWLGAAVPGWPVCCPAAAGLQEGSGDLATSAGAVASDTQKPCSPLPGRERSHPQGYPPTACHHFTPPECSRARCPGNQNASTLLSFSLLQAPVKPVSTSPRAPSSADAPLWSSWGRKMGPWVLPTATGGVGGPRLGAEPKALTMEPP